MIEESNINIISLIIISSDIKIIILSIYFIININIMLLST